MTKILTVRVANTGADSYVLTLYGAGGGGQRHWGGSSMGLEDFAELVRQWAQSADFVCVDETGLGAALIDMLKASGLGVLRAHRMRPLEAGLK